MSEYIDAVTAALKFGLDKGTGPARLDRESVRALINEIERLRARDEQHYRSVKQAWQAIPDEFKLSPTDGGGIDEHLAIADMAKEIERLRANLSEAIRLMEPVAEAEEATHWPYVVTVVRDDARAIADFVKRMRGGVTVNSAT